MQHFMCVQCTMYSSQCIIHSANVYSLYKANYIGHWIRNCWDCPKKDIFDVNFRNLYNAITKQPFRKWKMAKILNLYLHQDKMNSISLLSLSSAYICFDSISRSITAMIQVMKHNTVNVRCVSHFEAFFWTKPTNSQIT